MTLENQPQMVATWSYKHLKMTNIWYKNTQNFMFEPIILHYAKSLALNLLHNIHFFNLLQKHLLRVEKYAFVKVRINNFLQFDLTEKNRRDRFLCHFSTLCFDRKIFRQINYTTNFVNVAFTKILPKKRESTKYDFRKKFHNVHCLEKWDINH